MVYLKSRAMLFGILCVFLTKLQAENNGQISEKSKVNSLGTYNVSQREALAGFSSVTFFAFIPTSNKNLSDKINRVVEKELKKYGHAQTLEILVKKGDEEVVDLSGFDSGATLLYEIKKVDSLDGKSLPIIEASLNLTSQVSIGKTGTDCQASIWSDSCFLQGSLDKDLESLVRKSLDRLLQDFATTYSEANKAKPTFKVFLQ